MYGNVTNVNVSLSEKAQPRPTVTPAWTFGNGIYFVAVDFQADHLGNFRLAAVLRDRGIDSEFQTVDCALEDAEDFAADLVSDVRGFVYQTIGNAWETGDLISAVKSLAAKIEQRQAA